MLHNVNSYGLSHLCAFSIFELDEFTLWKYSTDYNTPLEETAFNYPFLDIYFNHTTNFEIKFYSRGFKYDKTTSKNLFEYLIYTEQNG